MLCRSSTAMFALTTAVMVTVNVAQAAEEAKYPNWKGEWIAILPSVGGQGVRFDPTKPFGPAQEAPLQSGIVERTQIPPRGRSTRRISVIASRVLMGRHYILDAAVGAVLGAIAAPLTFSLAPLYLPLYSTLLWWQVDVLHRWLRW